jgi:DNA-binding response OmpR family regulator
MLCSSVFFSGEGQSEREPAMQPDPPIVLVVDGIEDVYATGLSALGFQPVTANNAEEGLGQAYACPPAIVVVDLIIPLTSGLNLIRRFAPRPVHERCAYHRREQSPGSGDIRAREADRFLLKPCVPGTLAIAMRELLVNERPRSSWLIDSVPTQMSSPTRAC